MMRRRNGPDGISPRHHNRTSSDFVSSAEKGSYDDAASKGRGLGGGKSVIRRVSNAVRSRLRQVTKIGRQQGLGKGVGFLAACLLLLWCGLQTPRLLGEGAGGGLMEHRGGSQASGVAEAVTSGVTGDQTEKGGVELGPRLAYGIMVYQRKGSTMEKTFGQFIRMFDALYDKENTYVVHVDIKSSQGLRYAISTFLDDRNNAYEVPSVSVSWGGITVVERTLALMQKALEVDDSWRFFVNLGHEDYPSVSQAEARRWMKDQPDGRNFIKCWPIEKHDFFGQTERHESRVTDVNVDDFLGMVKEYRSLGGNPGSQERLRTDYKFYKSLQQTMLSRQLTEFAATSSEARRLLLYMATSKAPDELYFPTLTQLDERFSSMATCDDTRHFSYWIRPGGSWHPEYLTLDHLPLVLNSTDFYIRKVSPDWSSGLLLDVLDMLRSGRPLDDALPIVKDWLNRDSEDGSKLGAPGGPIKEFTSDSVTEGIDELLRRQSEDAEAKRCIFMSYIMRRGAQVRMAQIVAANRAAEVSNEVERPRTNFFEERSRPPAKNTRRADAAVDRDTGVRTAGGVAKHRR